jgi:hypothetical protein
MHLDPLPFTPDYALTTAIRRHLRAHDTKLCTTRGPDGAPLRAESVYCKTPLEKAIAGHYDQRPEHRAEVMADFRRTVQGRAA